MKKLVLLVAVLIFMIGCSKNVNSNNKLQIAVSIVPQKTFVEAVAGDKVDVVVMIPPGQNHETYSPNPLDLEKLSNASIYFSIGLPNENTNILNKAFEINKNLKNIKLQDSVSKVYPDLEISKGVRDPHIWLSPKRVSVMIDTICDKLSSIDTKNKDFYKKNAADYKIKLASLDNYIASTLRNVKIKSFVVYHPAFGYFANDYKLQMIALEEEGREATARELQEKISFAKQHKVKTIFYQAEVDNRQAKIFAQELHGTATLLSPLDPNYVDNLKKTARILAKNLGGI